MRYVSGTVKPPPACQYCGRRSNPVKGFHSSPDVIGRAVMMYFCFPLSLRNVEDLLSERGIDVSHEAISFWWLRSGPKFAAEIR